MLTVSYFDATKWTYCLAAAAKEDRLLFLPLPVPPAAPLLLALFSDPTSKPVQKAKSAEN